MLHVYWVGYGGNSWTAERLRYTIEDVLGMKLVTIHEHPNADIKWDINSVYQELQKADIIIVTANYKRQPCKSNNRLTQAMAMGKPVVCDPMPAYKNIIKQDINGFITENDSEGEWEKYLKILRDDSDLREKMGKEALVTAKEYSLEKTSNRWLEALVAVTNKPQIHVIIPTKNNSEILEKCLDSFKNSTCEEEVYIIENGAGTEELVKKYNVPVEIRRF